MNIVGRGANLPSYLKATSQVVASGLKPAAVAVPVTKESVTYVHPQSTVSCGLQGNVPSGWISAKSGLTGKCPASNGDAIKNLVFAAQKGKKELHNILMVRVANTGLSGTAAQRMIRNLCPETIDIELAFHRTPSEILFTFLIHSPLTPRNGPGSPLPHRPEGA